jgi:hypothetical protein
VNGAVAWLLSLFHWKHRNELQLAWQHNPWAKWWTQVEQRPNPLNALLATLHQPTQPTAASSVDQEGSPAAADGTALTGE